MNVTGARTRPCKFGSHRVLEPTGVLPQAAWRIDNTPAPRENEILCDVEVLNIDSASFRQIAEQCAHDTQAIGKEILRTVAQRGKQHNPITGSGGMFIGAIACIGTALRGRIDAAQGDRIASLVSLSLTPLILDEIVRVERATGRVWVRGKAILFESSAFVRLPDDIDDAVALAVLDVAGAPAQVRRWAQENQTVIVIGADGKAGMLACVEARTRVGAGGRVIGIAPSQHTRGAQVLLREGFVDRFLEADARDAIATARTVARALGELADLTINCVNVGGTELASILCTKDGGIVYFFSMATSFTAAALGAEGVGKDVTMMIGNGYAGGHAKCALTTLRAHPAIGAHFNAVYGTEA